MNAPFFKYGLFGDEISLVVAFAIGIGFGFFLERAGFGRARLLAAQFYFRDLRVLKVMFTAIITAMVGLFFLSRLGLVDLSLVYLTPTFVLPQAIGGLILGVGFVVGGYCPGTSCVSAATGRIDGMVYLAGMIGGLLGFAEIYPRIEHLVKATPMGQVTLAQQFNLPYGLLVFAVVLMAVGAFIAAEWAERKIGGKVPDTDSLLAPARPLAPVRRFAIVLVSLGLVAAFAGNPFRGAFARVDTKQLALDAGTKSDHVSVTQLADWIIEGRSDFVLVDVREPAEFASYHIPGARNVPLAELTPDFVARNERIVVCSEGGIHAAQAWFLLRSLGFPAVYLLFGGLEEWKDTVLYPAAPPASAPARDHIEFAKRAAVAKYFGGAPQTGGAPMPASTPALPRLTPPVPAAAPAGVPGAKPKKKKEGC
ncbi:MAG: YeeE/YedE family protein [Opitutaceae bacterium]|nr:YeeE/YedE family protein [Opitutaceae bacterium]